MTTQTTDPSADSRTASWPLFAALGVGIAAVLTVVGTFWNINGGGHNDYEFVRDYLPVIAVILVATLLVFGLVVRTAAGSGAGMRALVLGVLAFLSLAVFWAGLPPVLAMGAVACGFAARESTGHWGMPARIGMAIAAVTVVLAVVLAIVG